MHTSPLDPTEQKIDVLLNVFGKPYQTTLALASLLHFCGQYIDKIWFHLEPALPEIERHDFSGLLDFLQKKIILFHIPMWLSSETTDEERLLHDVDYRLSMRYQYGFENTDKQFALLIHNDIEVIEDFITPMLQNIEDAVAIGEIGQCWWCPAGQNNLCTSKTYTQFKPKYHQLMYLYNTNMDYTQRRAYNLGLRQEFWQNPWPLPECRVNEWAMLVNIHKARAVTIPFGKVAPIGAFYASGAKIGQNWDEDVNLDTGVQWFRELNLLGYTFKDFDIEKYIIHDRRGKVALSHNELYIKNEIRAKYHLREKYKTFYDLIN